MIRGGPTGGWWVQTVNGHAVDLLEPDLSDVTIDEVAHSLARISRFNGHTACLLPYTVAEHSVHVSRLTGTLHGLLHDAHEAFMGDVVSPLKLALRKLDVYGTHPLDEIDARLRAAVEKRWGGSSPLAFPERTHRADAAVLFYERGALMGRSPFDWGLQDPGENLKIGPPWSQNRAELEFLCAFRELGGVP